jgi:ankyrin repeat protein
MSGRLDRVRDIVTREGSSVINMPEQTTTRMYPLHRASDLGHLDIVRYLLNNGARPNVRDVTERTPIHLAASRGFASIVVSLLNKRAFINAMDRNRKKPIHYASEYGHVNIIRLLLERGVNVNQYDIFRKTPLHYAVENNHIGVVNILLHNGARLNVTDRYGRTPIRSAQSNGIRALLRHYTRRRQGRGSSAQGRNATPTSFRRGSRNHRINTNTTFVNRNFAPVNALSNIPVNKRVYLDTDVNANGKIKHVYHSDGLVQWIQMRRGQATSPFTRRNITMNNVRTLAN